MSDHRPACTCKHKYAQHVNGCTVCACQEYTEKPRRTKGDGALYKRGDGYWIGRVELPSLDGKRRFKTVSSRDRNACIAKLKKLRADVDEGRIAVTANTTVAKWLDRWVTEIHRAEIRPSTYRDYQTTIRLHINPHIGKKRLSQLTPEHVRQMHRAIESSRTAQKAHIVLQRALDDAVSEGMLARNVAKVVHKPKHAAQQREPLTADQAKQLIRSSIDNNDPMATRWAAAFLLGVRQGELLGLEKSRLDLANGVVDLAWQLQQLQQVHGCGESNSETYPCGRARPGWCPQRKWDLPRGFEHRVLHRSLALTRPKTQAGSRWVPIPLPLWYMLEQYQDGGTNHHGLVWHHPDGRPISPRDDHRNWTAALEAAGLPHAPLHVARHTTATLLRQAGVDEQQRMEILGHVSIRAQRGYAHGDLTMAREAMAALDQLLS